MGLRKSYFVLCISTSLGLYNVRGSVHSKTVFVCVLVFVWVGFGFFGGFAVVVGVFGTVCWGDLVNKQCQCELD